MNIFHVGSRSACATPRPTTQARGRHGRTYKNTLSPWGIEVCSQELCFPHFSGSPSSRTRPFRSSWRPEIYSPSYNLIYVDGLEYACVWHIRSPRSSKCLHSLHRPRGVHVSVCYGLRHQCHVSFLKTMRMIILTSLLIGPG